MKRASALMLLGALLVACTDTIAPPASQLRSVNALMGNVVTPGGVTYTTIDLGTLGGMYGQAYAINDAGQVAGSATRADGTYGAFFWNAGVMSDISLGGWYGIAFGINASGTVVGYGALPDNNTYHAFSWTNGTTTDLGAVPGDYLSLATGVNDHGQIVGYSSNGFRELPVLWEAGTMTALPLLGGDYGYANGINSHGDVVGYSALPGNSDYHGVIWHNGVATDLGALPGGTRSWAIVINDAGQAAGYSQFTDGTYHAFRWSGGVMTDLGTLGGSVSWAQDINNHGDVTGYSQTAAGYWHAFLWSNGVMTDLGSFDGNSSSFAVAVNEAKQVTGYSYTADGNLHAFLWDNGAMTDLGTLGGYNSQVFTWGVINNHGQIAGSANTATGEDHPVLWTPPLETTVTIDIKPGSTPNSVNPKAKGVIPVAVLSVGGFDATTIDVSTVKFGPGGASEAHNKGHIEDANGDGVPDMVLHFDTQASGIVCGTTSATLTGKTVGGKSIKGSDAVVTVSCR